MDKGAWKKLGAANVWNFFLVVGQPINQFILKLKMEIHNQFVSVLNYFFLPID